MEADLFQKIYDALQLGSKKLTLPVQHASPIHKIIWSSFDYMTGPELKFVWEANCLDERLAATPFSLSGDEVETDGTDSSDSSFSKTTANTGSGQEKYEDIDDIYASDLLTAAIIDDEIPLCEYEDLQIKGEFDQAMMARFQKRASIGDVCDVITNSTTTLGESMLTYKNEETPCSSKNQLETATSSNPAQVSDVETHVEESKEGLSEEGSKDPMVTSCVDSGIAGTISFHSDLSANCQYPDESPEKPSSSRAKFVEDQGYYDEVYATPKSTMNNSTFITSPTRRVKLDVNSSFYSAKEGSPPKKRIDIDREAELLNELAGEYGMQQLTDEEFIAKFVLAEQICSTQLPSSPLIHKMVVIPSRHIMFGSYLFPLKTESAHATMAAFSVVLSDQSYDWYMEKQHVIEEIFSDIVPRFKAAYLTETIEDLICRLVAEIAKIFDLFGALEKYSLNKIKIQSSFLWDGLDEVDIMFISKCVTGALMSRGHCVIVGNDAKTIMKLMRTLSLFLEEDQRRMSIKPYCLPFSPYLCLQAVKRKDFDEVLAGGTECHWPLTIVDIDRKLVTSSGPYVKHRHAKKALQLYHVGSILREAGVPLLPEDERRATREPLLDLHSIKPEESIRELLAAMKLLPLSRSARLTYIDHYHLRLENKATAFIGLIAEVSRPRANDKRSAISARWSLSAARRSLNLISESSIAIVLAKAESLLPSVAEFVAQNTKR